MVLGLFASQVQGRRFNTGLMCENLFEMYNELFVEEKYREAI